jgi:hypothetical protein
MRWDADRFFAALTPQLADDLIERVQYHGAPHPEGHDAAGRPGRKLSM